jgi:hypothetical protein
MWTLIGLAACDPQQATRAPPDGEIQPAFVVPPDKLVPASDLAAAVRQAGYPCEAVVGFAQLELNGRPLDNYRIDCAGHAYLLTFLEGGSRIRPWAGKAPAAALHD